MAPAINRTVFPGTKFGARSNDRYWASHRAVGSATAAWAINFDDGFTGKNDTTDTTAWNYFTNVWARCVRRVLSRSVAAGWAPRGTVYHLENGAWSAASHLDMAHVLTLECA